MDLKSRILRIFIYLVGLFCLFLYISVRLNESPLFLIDREFLEADSKGLYGDLYLFNLIDNFKILIPEELPPFKLSEKNSNPNDADILVFGDSFFAGKARGKQLPEKLCDTLKKKIYFSDSYWYLLDLKNQNYTPKKRKILILEIAQRNLFRFFSTPQPSEEVKSTKFDEFRTIAPSGFEKRYLYLLQHSVLTHKIYSTIATFKFNQLGCIPAITPVFKKDPPWLFDFQDVAKDVKTSFYYKYSDEELKNLCDYVKDLSMELDKQYNLKLVILPIPLKYVIYHKLFNNDSYNNLIPALCSELKKRNISVIEVLDDFLKTDKIIYYPTDTHYNQEGDNIVLKKILEFLKANPE